MDIDSILVEVSLFLNKELYDLGVINYQMFFDVNEMLLKGIGDSDI